MLKIFESEQLPPYLQIESMMSNSEMFANTFLCSRGSPMNNYMAPVEFPKIPMAAFGEYHYDYFY